MITQSYDVMELRMTDINSSSFRGESKPYREIQLKSKTGEIISIMLNAETSEQLEIIND